MLSRASVGLERVAEAKRRQRCVMRCVGLGWKSGDGARRCRMTKKSLASLL